MPTIAQLNQRHPDCAIEDLRDLWALYDGDKPFRERLGRFLLARPAESPKQYELRKQEAHYRNYLGAIVDYFAAMLFTSSPRALAKSRNGESKLDVDEYYERFREDCDRGGSDVDAFFKERLTEAMVYRCSWIAIEQPSAEIAPSNRLQFEQMKLGDCWLRQLSFEGVLDWELDDAGNLEWVLVKSSSARRGSLASGRDQVTDTWDHYLPDRIDTYQIEYDKTKPPSPDKTEVPLIASRAHNFGRTPVVCLQLPLGLWAANRLSTPQLAHFRAINAQTWSMSRTCYAMPVFKVKDGNAFNQTLGSGYAITIEPDEDASWLAPPDSHFSALDTEIKAQKDEIFRLAHQMALGVDNNAGTVGRSAESKSQDAQSTRVVLMAYARVVKETIELVYDMISRARGDDLTWSVEGFDDFAGVDAHGLVTIAAELEAAGGVPSKSFNADLKFKIAQALLPDADEARKSTYRQEIEEGTPEPGEEDLNELTRLHAQAAGITRNAITGGTGPGGGAKPSSGAAGSVRRRPPADKPS